MSETVTDDPHLKIRTKFYKKLDLSIGPLTLDDTRKLEGKEFKADSKTMKDKVLYEDRRERVEAMIVQLRDYSPAADGLISKFIDMTLQADGLLKKDPMAWEAAGKALHAEHLKKALDEADKLWGEREKKARGDKTAKPAYESIDRLNRQITEARAVLTPARLAEHEAESLKIERALLGSDLKATAVKQANDAVARRLILVGNETETAGQTKADAVLGGKALAAALQRLEATDDVGPISTDAERASLLRDLRSGETAMATREFVLAKDVFDRAVTTARELLRQNTEDRGEWAKVAGQVATLAERARSLARSATSPEVKATALEQAKRLEEVADLKPGDGLTYADATARVSGAIIRLGQLAEEEQGYAGFLQGREAADGRIKVLLGTVATRLETLRKTVAEAVDDQPPDVAGESFVLRRDSILGDWRKRVETAPDADTLNERQTTQELMQLAADIRLATIDPGTLSKAIDAGALIAAQEAYALARKAAGGLVDDLAELDAIAAGRFELLLRAEDAKLVKAASGGPYGVGAATVQRIGNDAAKVEINLRIAVEKAQDLLAERLRNLPEMLGQIVEAAQKMSKPAERKATLDQQAALQAAYDGLRSVRTLTQLDVLNEATAAAEGLGKDLRLAVAAATGAKLPGGEEAYSFADATKCLNNIKVNLAEDDVKTYRTASAAELGDTITALEKGLGALTPSALEKEVGRIAREAERLAREAAESKEWAARFKTEEIDAIKAMLAKAPYKEFKEFVKSTEAQLKTIQSDAEFEGGRTDAMTAARRLRERLAELAKTPGSLESADYDLVTADNKAVLDRKKFEADCEVLAKRVDALKTYPDDKAGLEEALKSAKQAAKSDLDTAREQLAGVRDRLAMLTLNPKGLGIHVRKQLPSVNARWRKAVAGFGGALDGLDKAIDKLADGDLDAAGKKAVKAAIAGTRTLFNPAVFVKPLQVVIAEDSGEPQRAAAREVALRDVRRQIAYLYDDYRMQQLAACPFDSTLRGVISELNLALLDLENNLLVSM